MSFGRLLVALDDSSRCKRALARHLFACHNWTNIPWMISASISIFSTTFIARTTNCQLSGRRRQRFIPHGKVSCRTYRYRWLKWHIVTINNSDREETDTRTLSFAIAPTFAQPLESSKAFRYSSVYAAQMFAWTINGLTSFAVLSKGKLFRLNRKFLLPTKVPSSHNEHSLRGRRRGLGEVSTSTSLWFQNNKGSQSKCIFRSWRSQKMHPIRTPSRGSRAISRYFSWSLETG